jgi:hypothetical protein
VLGNPRCKRFAWQSLRDVDVIFAFASKIKNFGNINVTQPLNSARLFFELFPDGRIDAFYWD